MEVLPMYEYRRGGSIFGAFLLGGLVGAVLGLLFAPRSGRETREVIAQKAEEYWGEGVEFYNAGAERIVGQSSQIRVKIDQARERLQEQVVKTSETAKSRVADVVPAAQSAVERAAEMTKGGIETAGHKAQETLDVVSQRVRPVDVSAAGSGDLEQDTIPEI